MEYNVLFLQVIIVDLKNCKFLLLVTDHSCFQRQLRDRLNGEKRPICADTEKSVVDRLQIWWSVNPFAGKCYCSSV